MKLPLLPTLLLLGSISLGAAFAQCDWGEEEIFTARGSVDYLEAMRHFVDQGGNPAKAIVTIRDQKSILDSLPKQSKPKDFKYSRKFRNLYGHKFSLSKDCLLRVSKYPYSQRRVPAKNVHHHLLASGNHAFSAGVIFIFHDGKKVEQVVIANRSSRFCPTIDSLNIVKQYLERVGIKSKDIVLTDGTRKVCQPLTGWH
jgi:hypothetical protein